MERQLCPLCGRLDPFILLPCHCQRTGSNGMSEGMVARLRRLAIELKDVSVA